MWRRIGILLSLSCFATGISSFAQTAEETPFCDRKWYCEMTKGPDGIPHVTDSSSAKDYMDFRCDSTFTLSEQGTVLKGTWSYDPGTMTITLFQKQMLTIPERITFHVIEYDGEKLVIIGQEGTSSEETAYLYSK
ncbi:MAG: hypothetical protein JNM41_13215 [Flavipsychrobacter sp.]|nr:hypothetical protein [Flavipsychrobacter sp.]